MNQFTQSLGKLAEKLVRGTGCEAFVGFFRQRVEKTVSRIFCALVEESRPSKRIVVAKPGATKV